MAPSIYMMHLLQGVAVATATSADQPILSTIMSGPALVLQKLHIEAIRTVKVCI